MVVRSAPKMSKECHKWQIPFEAQVRCTTATYYDVTMFGTILLHLITCGILLAIKKWKEPSSLSSHNYAEMGKVPIRVPMLPPRELQPTPVSYHLTA